ncbi:hypothetical protein NPIL_135441, partial [Nephila pilipes]
SVKRYLDDYSVLLSFVASYEYWSY